jgi:uncharacterized protein YdaU (DUF1376 family)
MSKKLKPYWMALHVEKFLADTGSLSLSEIGAYIVLLCNMWRSEDGTLPNDDDRLARSARVYRPHWHRIWSGIKDLFDIDGDRVTSTDLQADLGKANALIVMRRAQGKLGGETTQFKRSLNANQPLKLMASKPLKDNKVGGSNCYSQLQLQDNKKEGEGSPLPLPRMGVASGPPHDLADSPPTESPKMVCREEADSPSLGDPLNQALANFGEAFRRRGGGR